MKKLPASLLTLALILSITFNFACKSETKNKVKSDPVSTESAESENTYSVDIANSIVYWEGSKPTSKHSGVVKVSSGSLGLTGDKIVNGEITIDMNSIENTDLSGNSKTNLEAHLKGTTDDQKNDFFDVRSFPTAKFEIIKVVELKGDDVANSMVYGNLTIKDITKRVVFKAIINTSGDQISAESSLFSIDRTEWGIKYGSGKFFDNLKDKVINDEIVFSISIKASKS